jgi:hypothetical protein
MNMTARHPLVGDMHPSRREFRELAALWSQALKAAHRTSTQW